MSAAADLKFNSIRPMKTVSTYRKHTTTDLIAACKAAPNWTEGGDLIAEMPDGNIAFSVTLPHRGNDYDQRIWILNCMSVQVPGLQFGAPVVAMDIDDEEVEELEALLEEVWAAIS